MEMPSAALYPFGYGLSYTQFDYSGLSLENLGGNRVKVNFNLSNTGERDGDEVVQIYLTDTQASTVRPRKQLRAFERVAVAKGETKRLEFELDEEDFALWNSGMEFVVEPGEFIVSVGASSEDIRLQGTVVL